MNGAEREIDSDLGLGSLRTPASGLRQHAVRQTGVTLGGQIIQAILQLGSIMVLARLLVPSDFGLIAMVAVLVGLVGLFRDIGLTQAVIQQEELSNTQATGIFWTSVSVTVVSSIVMAAAAPLVAWFYGEPDLMRITLAFAGVFLIGGLGMMPQAILARNMEFSKIVVGEVLSTVLGIAAAIALAALGAGYWALVALPGVRAVAMTIILWSVCPWRPGRPRRRTGIGAMLRFGTNVTGFNLVNYFARNADNVLIGWRWGAGQLGQYAAAYRLLLMPLTQINAPLTRVAVPTLARLKNDPDRYREAYLRIVRLLATLTAPAMAFAAVTADWIVAILLGPGWEEAATILAWLAIAGVVQPLNNTTGWLFLTQDRTGEFFLWGTVSALLTVSAIAIGLQYGAVGVAIAYAISGVAIRTPLLLAWVGRRGPVSTRDLFTVLAFPLLLSLWTAGSSLLVKSLAFDFGPLAGLSLALAVSGAGCATIVVMTPTGRRLISQARAIASDLKRSKS